MDAPFTDLRMESILFDFINHSVSSVSVFHEAHERLPPCRRLCPSWCKKTSVIPASHKPESTAFVMKSLSALTGFAEECRTLPLCNL